MAKYVRYRAGSSISNGTLEGAAIHEISGGLFGAHAATGVRHDLSSVKLLYPVEAGKILAVGLNYKSHLQNRPQPENPEIFYKPPSSLQDPEGPVEIPRDATDVHYEGELVLVIGKRATRVSRDEARAAIFGVTCGNDVSERQWQHGPHKDKQWWRAKGCDTFAPLGPSIVTGLDPDRLLLKTRLNGEVVQEQCTSDLIFDSASIVSWVSQWVTLMPGDLIYTGTPQSTRKLAPGDVVEVDIEGIGVLRNPVVAG